MDYERVATRVLFLSAIGLYVLFLIADDLSAICTHLLTSGKDATHES